MQEGCPSHMKVMWSKMSEVPILRYFCKKVTVSQRAVLIEGGMYLADPLVFFFFDPLVLTKVPWSHVLVGHLG